MKKTWKNSTYDITQIKGDTKKIAIFNISPDIKDQNEY